VILNLLRGGLVSKRKIIEAESEILSRGGRPGNCRALLVVLQRAAVEGR